MEQNSGSKQDGNCDRELYLLLRDDLSDSPPPRHSPSSVLAEMEFNSLLQSGDFLPGEFDIWTAPKVEMMLKQRMLDAPKLHAGPHQDNMQPGPLNSPTGDHGQGQYLPGQRPVPGVPPAPPLSQPTGAAAPQHRPGQAPVANVPTSHPVVAAPLQYQANQRPVANVPSAAPLGQPVAAAPQQYQTNQWPGGNVPVVTSANLPAAPQNTGQAPPGETGAQKLGLRCVGMLNGEYLYEVPKGFYAFPVTLVPPTKSPDHNSMNNLQKNDNLFLKEPKVEPGTVSTAAVSAQGQTHLPLTPKMKVNPFCVQCACCPCACSGFPQAPPTDQKPAT